MEQQGNNYLTLEDVAEMVKRGFDGMATKEDLNALRMETKEDFKMPLEELNATHVDVQYIRRTIDMLTQSDTAQEMAIDDLVTRVHHVEEKIGLIR